MIPDRRATPARRHRPPRSRADVHPHRRSRARRAACAIASACAARRAADSGWIRQPRGRSGQRDHQRRDAELDPASGNLAAYDDRRLRVARGATGRADGQFGGWALEHRRGPRGLPGFHAHRSRDRHRPIRAQSRSGRRIARGKARRFGFARAGPPLPGRCPQSRTADRRAGGHGRRRGSEPDPRTRVSRWPRHAAAQCGRFAGVHGWRVRATSRCAHCIDRRPLLRNGPRPALGSRRCRL